MEFSASGSASAACDSTGDDGGDDNIVRSSHKKQKAVSMKKSTALKEMEIEEQKNVPRKKSTIKSESSSAAAAVARQESSESDGDGETVPRIFQKLPPSFPPRFAKLINDPESIRPRILMEKRLHSAHVDENRNRLSISPEKMKEVFLLPEEEAKLKSGKVMEVQVIEPDGETMSSLALQLRRERASYVLTRAWNYVVARNSDALKMGRLLRVWYFRVNGGLWFALEVVEQRIDCGIAKLMSDKWHRQNVLAP